MLRKLVNNPWYTFSIAVMVLLSGLLDMAEFAFETWFEVAVGVEHGVIAWGIGQLLRALVDIFEGIEGISPRQGYSKLAGD